MKVDSDVSAVVCGGASGMGATTVRTLRKAGASVAILDFNEELGNKVAEDTGAVFLKMDALNEESVVSAFESARARQGQERILVHTIGGGAPLRTAWRDEETGEIHRVDFEQFTRISALNLNTTVLCASISAAGMLALFPNDEGERGVIIMTSSIASQDGPAGALPYVAGKAGVNGVTLSMARDLGPEGIRVNTILPGTFDTPMYASVPEDYKNYVKEWNLFPKRFGTPEEYASLAMQLISNGYINAGLFRIDGGARV